MILTVILVRGIRESAEANNTMVILKIAAIFAFIIAGAHYVHPENWHPFAPNGFSGILTGGSIIFFTYIGFDSVSTAAEEAKNPQRDLPIGIIATLVICTVLYIGVAVTLTGLVPWQSMLDDAAPVVNSLKKLTLSTGSHSLHWVRLGVLFGAMMGMISSLLVFQLGQARVWFAMSRDGLMPKLFGRVHPRFRTPATATWIAGFVVGLPAGILDIGTLADLSNIGTLFAFVLVSIGVIILRFRDPGRHRGFRAPGGLAAPVLSVFFCILLMSGLPILTWLRFFGWLIIGLTIYWLYSRHHSEFAGREVLGARHNRGARIRLWRALCLCKNSCAIPHSEIYNHNLRHGPVRQPAAQRLSRLSSQGRTPPPSRRCDRPGNPARDCSISHGLKTATLADVEKLYQYSDFTGFLMAFKAITEHLQDARRLRTHHLSPDGAAEGRKHPARRGLCLGRASVCTASRTSPPSSRAWSVAGREASAISASRCSGSSMPSANSALRKRNVWQNSPFNTRKETL